MTRFDVCGVFQVSPRVERTSPPASQSATMTTTRLPPPPPNWWVLLFYHLVVEWVPLITNRIPLVPFGLGPGLRWCRLGEGGKHLSTRFTDNRRRRPYDYYCCLSDSIGLNKKWRWVVLDSHDTGPRAWWASTQIRADCFKMLSDWYTFGWHSCPAGWMLARRFVACAQDSPSSVCLLLFPSSFCVCVFVHWNGRVAVHVHCAIIRWFVRPIGQEQPDSLGSQW